mmetsp:Transcript_76975/g.200542  ORF Transcript_76975/g.200542 Transcript_76975/m.200542 type:complete len:269 (+) Transcript_76975:832-1638(+)
MMPLECRYSIASTTDAMKNNACSSLMRPISRIAVNRSPPVKLSIKKYTLCSSWKVVIKRTISGWQHSDKISRSSCIGCCISSSRTLRLDTRLRANSTPKTPRTSTRVTRPNCPSPRTPQVTTLSSEMCNSRWRIFAVNSAKKAPHASANLLRCTHRTTQPTAAAETSSAQGSSSRSCRVPKDDHRPRGSTACPPPRRRASPSTTMQNLPVASPRFAMTALGWNSSVPNSSMTKSSISSYSALKGKTPQSCSFRRLRCATLRSGCVLSA